MSAARDLTGHQLVKAEPGTLIWSEPLPDGGQAVVKVYRRRAFYDPVRRWFVPYRVEREYALLAHLFRSGVPCSEPLWWLHDRNRAHGRHELLATREIEGAIPLVDLLGGAAQPDLAPLFALARRMHECGIAHGAFYPTNILVTRPTEPAAQFHLVDLAHGCRFADSIVGSRPARFDLLDMLRAIERRRSLAGCAEWVAGYGLNAPGVAAILNSLPAHRLERPWRHLHRAETDLRAARDRIRRRAASRGSPAATQIPPGMRPG